MKNLLLLATLLALAAGPARAQSTPKPAPVLAADAAAQPGPYCTITGHSAYNSLSRMHFELEYGRNAQQPPENELFVEKQKIEALQTVADMLNYMAARGWELVSSGAPTMGLYYFVLRKK